ncbi:hypothetical protein [Rhizobium sp. FKL33]|uniref:hypothetical protein n=1 Tax=Rhizobium sp. FKL33 TaxID=2562307 RepID=UPI0010C0C334|nr:hypothetical protein [Rhizobium sp. FKL33]
MANLLKRILGKGASPEISPVRPAPEQGAHSAARVDEARLAARRVQISNDLFELQQIAIAELALRKRQDAAAAKAGYEAEDGVGGRVLIV